MPDDRFGHSSRWIKLDRIPDRRWGGGVYVLYRAGEVVYVGHTGNFRTRLLFHRRRCYFDAVKVAPIDNRRERQRLERRLIFRLRPAENRVVPSVLRPGGFLYSLSYRPMHGA